MYVSRHGQVSMQHSARKMMQHLPSHAYEAPLSRRSPRGSIGLWGKGAGYSEGVLKC
jgi:hypothetical protein